MFGFQAKFDGAGGGGGRVQTADTVDSAYMLRPSSFLPIHAYSCLIGYPGIQTSVSFSPFALVGFGLRVTRGLRGFERGLHVLLENAASNSALCKINKCSDS